MPPLPPSHWCGNPRPSRAHTYAGWQTIVAFSATISPTTNSTCSHVESISGIPQAWNGIRRPTVQPELLIFIWWEPLSYTSNTCSRFLGRATNKYLQDDPPCCLSSPLQTTRLVDYHLSRHINSKSNVIMTSLLYSTPYRRS